MCMSLHTRSGGDGWCLYSAKKGFEETVSAGRLLSKVGGQLRVTTCPPAPGSFALIH